MAPTVRTSVMFYATITLHSPTNPERMAMLPFLVTAMFGGTHILSALFHLAVLHLEKCCAHSRDAYWKLIPSHEIRVAFGGTLYY